MNYTLFRYFLGTDDTLGLLFKENVIKCYTLEDAVRPVKIPGMTAIPTGRYKLKLTHMPTLSAKYGHDMVEISGVPNYSGVAIHVGNTNVDTNGCLLVGFGVSLMPSPVINSSRNCYDALYPQLVADIKAGDTFLVVRNVG